MQEWLRHNNLESMEGVLRQLGIESLYSERERCLRSPSPPQVAQPEVAGGMKEWLHHHKLESMEGALLQLGVESLEHVYTLQEQVSLCFPDSFPSFTCLVMSLTRLFTYYYQSTGVYTEPDYYCLNVIWSSPPRVGVGVPILPILPTRWCGQGTPTYVGGGVLPHSQQVGAWLLMSLHRDGVQGDLAHRKQPLPRTLQEAHA